MRIGPHALYGPCRLAPMASISNTPFRLVCKEQGSSLTTSEEISAKALVYNSVKTLDLASYLPEEKPIAIQIFGSEAEILAEAAKILVGQGADIIDLNMGCPVPKITKTGAGSALMRDPVEAGRIFRTIRAAINVPFTIKIRGGWDDHHLNAPEIAKIAESEGVDSIAVHPRTRSQQYTGHAPWSIIKQVVEAVKIPVTGNGDVKCWDDAYRMLRETGCQSVMIGRGALGNPWIFNPAFERMAGKEREDYKLRVIQRHMELIQAHMNPKLAEIQAKKHLAWYATGRQGSAAARAKIFELETLADTLDFFYDYWVGPSVLTAAAEAEPMACST